MDYSAKRICGDVRFDNAIGHASKRIAICPGPVIGAVVEYAQSIARIRSGDAMQMKRATSLQFSLRISSY